MKGPLRIDRAGLRVVRVLGLGAAVGWSAGALMAQERTAEAEGSKIPGEVQGAEAEVQAAVADQRAPQNVETASAAEDPQTLLLQWLLAEQRAMVDLARWGQQHAEHPDVRRLARMVVQDHSQLIESLQQASSDGGDGRRVRAAEGRNDRQPLVERRDERDRRERPDRRLGERRDERFRQDQRRDEDEEGRLLGQRREDDRRSRGERRSEDAEDQDVSISTPRDGEDRSSRRDSEDRRADTPPDEDPRTEQPDDDEQQEAQRVARQQQEEGEGVLERLADRADRAVDRARQVIERVEEVVDPERPRLDRDDRRSAAKIAQLHQQIVEETKRVARQELEDKRRGAELDTALVGMLIAAHIREQASLNVLSQHATGDLQNLLEQASDDVQHHLQRSHQVMQQIERAKRGSRR